LSASSFLDFEPTPRARPPASDTAPVYGAADNNHLFMNEAKHPGTENFSPLASLHSSMTTTEHPEHADVGNQGLLQLDKQGNCNKRAPGMHTNVETTPIKTNKDLHLPMNEEFRSSEHPRVITVAKDYFLTDGNSAMTLPDYFDLHSHAGVKSGLEKKSELTVPQLYIANRGSASRNHDGFSSR
jgi:hypothetical protein